jgi:hypothetical protein
MRSWITCSVCSKFQLALDALPEAVRQSADKGNIGTAGTAAHANEAKFNQAPFKICLTSQISTP